MTLAFRSLPLVLVALAVFAQVLPIHVHASSGSPPLGTISGTVRDGKGKPLIGAVISVMSIVAGEPVAKLMKEAVTDDKGKFVASGIEPGHYNIEIAAKGFPKSLFKQIDVRPNDELIYHFTLRRTGTLVDQRADKDDYKYVLRSSRRPILRNNDSSETVEADMTVALTKEQTPVHGLVQFAAQNSSGKSLSSNYLGANFAITHSFSRNVNAVFFGQSGIGQSSPQRFEGIATIQAGQHHTIRVGAGYGRVMVGSAAASSLLQQLKQYSIRATDSWQLAGPIILVFGFDYSRFGGPSSADSLQPRLGVQYSIDNRTRLYAALLPGSSRSIQESVSLEENEIVFTQPETYIAAGEQVLPNRSRRIEFGLDRILSEDSNIQAAFFFDTASNRGVGILAVPINSAVADELQFAAAQNGQARGGRIVYSRHFNHILSGAFGYAFGQGQYLSPEGIVNPAALFKNGNYQVAVAKINADFLRTGTHVSTVFRLAPDSVVFAIDPFQGQLATYDPNISIIVTQAIPTFGFLPGRLEAMVDVRNLLDKQTGTDGDMSRLIISQSQRTIRGGISFRF